MSEKKGMTGKLFYDFKTSKAVYVKNGEKYSRITERDFRSFNGERFILEEGEYKPYNGPIYYWNTNRICKNPIGENKIQYASDNSWKTLVRPHERHLL